MHNWDSAASSSSAAQRWKSALCAEGYRRCYCYRSPFFFIDFNLMHINNGFNIWLTGFFLARSVCGIIWKLYSPRFYFYILFDSIFSRMYTTPRFQFLPYFFLLVPAPYWKCEQNPPPTNPTLAIFSRMQEEIIFYLFFYFVGWLQARLLLLLLLLLPNKIKHYFNIFWMIFLHHFAQANRIFGCKYQT